MTSDTYPVHRLVFKNDLDGLRQALTTIADRSSLDQKCRGQTPLTLAVSLGRKECAKLLLEAGASTLVRNAQGWTPFQEATSFGDRELMELIFRKRRAELANWLKTTGRDVLWKISEDLNNFYLEMRWSFGSYVPFVSSICPSDTYKIFKKGRNVRIDTTLVGFESLSWLRGDISIVFTEESEGSRLVICDHQRKLVQQLWPRDFTIGDDEIAEELSISLNTTMVTPPEFDLSRFSLSRTKSGFWTFKIDRNERVGPWETSVWSVDAVECVTKTRTEHLEVHPLPVVETEPEPKKEKEPPKASGSDTEAGSDEGDDRTATTTKEEEDELIRKYETGEWTAEEGEIDAKKAIRKFAHFRPTLDPPPSDSVVSYDDFFAESKLDEFLHVGRPMKIEHGVKKGSATLWMYNGAPIVHGASAVAAQSVEDSEEAAATYSFFPTVVQAKPTPPISIQSDEFPLKVETLWPLLDLIGMGADKNVGAFKEFLNKNLPPGFPVQIEIPVGLLPLSALVTFQNISTTFPIEDKMFAIPGKKEGYRRGEVVSGSDGSI
ncbi:GPCR-chaperone-domain-containing protein [Fimicolochytrium jonesii]|uniref:GPCR-chaperone-domain-containing protein n=1 Tax=Fimicolochytrium jonesii TaxID=1396493 RepID=UPI0022FE8053|nr:GPCR-chaperone-domain-containing protein [Fimicolochytrium jonesii]KAI8820237.1 GPCR-chaperone-domain-containing protein [Fimicolochytrium jonesii]